MRIFGLVIQKATPPNLQAITEGRGGWWPYVRESFAGAWQKNVEIDQALVVSYSAVYSCITLIAADVGKIRIRLVEQQETGIWTEKEAAAFSPVLRRPNRYQNRIQFITQWVISKLLWGNTYVLKERDNRNTLSALYILDPSRVRPLVTPEGDVYYQLNKDNLAGIDKSSITVPAKEIIHDVMVPLYHPLVGVSPIFACGLAATQGYRIQTNSAQFFGNNSAPGGVLTAPSAISQVTADRLKADWEQNFSGKNFGRVAVLGDGLRYDKMMINPADAQLLEQLKWSAETVCSCFHVPAYMIGVGSPPPYNNIEALNQQYYTQCLQSILESIELCLDEGMELPSGYGTEFDISSLLRMDTSTHVQTLAAGIKGAVFSPNEARLRLDLPPVAGGDTPYLQQQNYSLRALDARDQLGAAAFVKPKITNTTGPAIAEEQAMKIETQKALATIERELEANGV